MWINTALRGALTAMLLVASVALADETRIIFLKNHTAADLIPVIRPLLGPTDAITGTDYRLIVRTSDERFAEIEKIIARLDVARRQLRITVQQSVAATSDNSNVGVSGNVGDGDVRVRLPRPSRSGSGGAVIERDGVRIETRQSRVTSRHNNSQFVNTLDGSRAFVRVGQSIPHVQRILLLSGRNLVLAEGVAYHDIVTGFDVLPRVQGDRIRVEITPRLSSLRDPRTGLVDFQEFSTTVTVKPGEWIDIGGLSGQGAEVRRAILSSASSDANEQRTVMIKVD
jgi:hypothetical protein